MRKGPMIAIIVIVLALAGGGIFALNHKSTPKTPAPTTTSDTSTTTTQSTSTDSTTPDQTNTSTTQTTTTTDTTTSSTTISYDGSSFSPSTVTVKAGSSIIVKNASSSSLDFDSDPHPTHTDNPELNIGNISPGKSVTITVNKKGTWGYHNHLNSSQHGTLVVQ